MKNCDFEIVVKKIVDHSIVRHINRKLNTSNRKVEGTLIKSPRLVKFAANIVLTTNMSFLEKAITYLIQNGALAKSHTTIKTRCM